MHANDAARCVLCGGATIELCRFPDTSRSAARCASCGHRQLLPQPDEATLESLYGHEEYFSEHLASLHGDLGAGYDPDSPIARLYRRHLDRIAALVAPPARLLDVGSARGVFAHLAKRRGYDATVTDRNPYGVAYAVRHFGLSGVAGRFEDVGFGGQFDVITSFDVIEHVPDPAAFLSRAASLLAPNGIAVIGTPDASSPLLRVAEFAARATRGRWCYPLWRVYGNGYEHLHLFTRASLANLARRAGLVPEASYGYSIPARNMRDMPPAYSAAIRMTAFMPYETVLIARKK